MISSPVPVPEREDGASVEVAPLHRHWLVFHRHPNWHGHCRLTALYEGHPFAEVFRKHSCRRWHFHLPFKHRHTPSGR